MSDINDGWYWTKDSTGRIVAAEIYTEREEKRITFTNFQNIEEQFEDENLFDFANKVCPIFHPIVPPPEDF